MKKIYIFGTGGFAKEVYFLIQEINHVNYSYEVAGFIDIAPTNTSIAIGSKKYEVQDEKQFFSTTHSNDTVFAIGIGNPKIVQSLLQNYGHKYNFPNLIHPSAIGMFETIKLGSGNIITAGCIFTVDINIGSFNIFNLNSTIGHDTTIGNCNVINPGTNISGGVTIGNSNLLGTNSTVLQYVEIGNNNAIGAGAVVNKAIENNKVAVGVPAKIIKDNN